MSENITIPTSIAQRPCATQWLGPIAMHQPIFSMMWGIAQKMDIEAVVAQHAERKAKEGDGGHVAYHNMAGVAVIPMSGPVSKEESSMGDVFGGTSTTRVRAALQQALSDPAVHAIVMHIDSPGGTVAGVGDLADDIFAARKKKRIVSYYEDLAASAAYWLGSQASESYASRHAEIGSIGVYSGLYDYSKQAEMEGVKAILVSSGGVKGQAGLPGAPVSDEAVAEMQKGVDRVNELFIEAVARGRGMDAEKVRKVNTGQLWSAKEAKRLGLVDDVQPLSKVLSMLRESVPRGSRADSQFTISVAQSGGPSTVLTGTTDATVFHSWSRDTLVHLEVAAMEASEDGEEVVLEALEEAGKQRLQDVIDGRVEAIAELGDAPSKAQYNNPVISSDEGSQEPIVTDEAKTMEPNTPTGKPAPAAPNVAAGAGPVPVPSVPLSEVEALIAKATGPLVSKIEALEQDKTTATTKRIDDKRRRIALKHKVPESTLAAYSTEEQLDGIDALLASRSSKHLDLVQLAPESPLLKVYEEDEKERKAWLATLANAGKPRTV